MMHTIATTKIKPEARAVLQAAAEHYKRVTGGDGTITEMNDATWFQPRDLGPRNRCSMYLSALIYRGFIERRNAKPGAWRERIDWEYRITPAGLEELEQ